MTKVISQPDTIRLNLGSRDRKIEGFLNVDCDEHPGVDLVTNVENLKEFGDNSVAEIYASHILEHFPHTKTVQVLKEWHRVLAPSGMLYLAVPDFERAVELYHKGGLGDWVVNFLWGDQIYPTAFHYAAFDYTRLRSILGLAGFEDITRVVEFPVKSSIRDCSLIRSTFDHKPVSLNVIAIK